MPKIIILCVAKPLVSSTLYHPFVAATMFINLSLPCFCVIIMCIYYYTGIQLYMYDVTVIVCLWNETSILEWNATQTKA